ncbi:hypothetical protein MTP03_20790 [Tsukamurella sp. PLM1]|nr:hypothetical protein MTP03_20790 [Tsukamurella sp. PLM1]
MLRRRNGSPFRSNRRPVPVSWETTAPTVRQRCSIRAEAAPGARPGIIASDHALDRLHDAESERSDQYRDFGTDVSYTLGRSRGKTRPGGLGNPETGGTSEGWG